MGLEELLQEFVNALEVERNSNWLQGDIVAEAVKQYGREVIGTFAEAGRCTKERIKQLVRLAVAFPEDRRLPEVPWSWYRAVYQAAKRLNKEPLEVMELALANEWSQADLTGLGKEDAPRARLSRRCDWCGSKVSIEADGGLAGETIYCPVCRVANEEEHQLGVLSID